jgi:drug/metabolite transporter (DMT)-like permease
MQSRTRKIALTEGVAAGVLFGTASILIRFLPNLNTFSIAFWRLVIACLALLTVLLLLRKPFDLRAIGNNFGKLLALSIFLGLHFLFFISAVKDTTILNATVLVNTTPIFSVFVSSFLFKLKPSRTAMLGIAVSIIGICVIALAESVAPDLYSRGGSPSLKGDVEAILAALVESFYLSYGKTIRNRMSILSIMMPIYALTAGIVVAFSVSSGAAIVALPIQLTVLIPLLGLGILPTAMAHTLYFSSLSNLKSFETATMALLEPVGATVLGIGFFQELPAPVFVLGAALVLLGVFFVGRNER